MSKKVLRTKYEESLNNYKETISNFKQFKDKDLLIHSELFFSEALINEMIDVYSLDKLNLVEIANELGYIQYSYGFSFDDEDPTPNAENLRESVSQMLAFIPRLNEINHKKLTTSKYPGSNLSIKNTLELIHAFFDRYEKLNYNIVIDNKNIMSFEDSSKNSFLKTVEEFNKKISKVKGLTPENTAIISALKVDLGSLIRNINADEGFDFKINLDEAKKIAAKAEPVIQWIMLGNSIEGEQVKLLL